MKEQALSKQNIESKIAKIRRDLAEMRQYKVILAEEGLTPDRADKEKESGLIIQLLRLEKILNGGKPKFSPSKTKKNAPHSYKKNPSKNASFPNRQAFSQIKANKTHQDSELRHSAKIRSASSPSTKEPQGDSVRKANNLRKSDHPKKLKTSFPKASYHNKPRRPAGSTPKASGFSNSKFEDETPLKGPWNQLKKVSRKKT